jgi:hypothetical protein
MHCFCITSECFSASFIRDLGFFGATVSTPSEAYMSEEPDADMIAISLKIRSPSTTVAIRLTSDGCFGENSTAALGWIRWILLLPVVGHFSVLLLAPVGTR